MSLVEAVLLLLGFIGLSAKSEDVKRSDSAVTLGPIVQLNARGESITQLWAHADASDASHMMVCGMVLDPANNMNSGHVYSSSDRGASWHRPYWTTQLGL
jgi:hypothetical protein